MEDRVKSALWVAALLGLGTAGCSSGPCPSGTLLVNNACVEVEGESCAIPTALYRDVDRDGFGDSAVVSAGCKREGFSEIGEDCDDRNPDTHPNAPEQCNDVDDDCDGVVDNDPQVLTWYLDFDDDGFGDPDVETESCLRPEGHVSNAADCNDENVDVSPTAPELCNQMDDSCSGVVDDGPQMECAVGEIVECSTECGTMGTAQCTSECRVAPECVPPIEACDSIDNNCDGVVDEGLLDTSVGGTLDFHDGFLTDASARLVSTKNGLFLFYFGRQWIQSAQSYTWRLYMVKIADDGQFVGIPTLIRESPAPGGTGPIHVVTVGYSAYVAIPPTDAGPELLRVSLVDLFEITSVAQAAHGRWPWQGQCLATDGATVAWGNIYWDVLQSQVPLRNDLLVGFYDNDLRFLASHGVSTSRAKAEDLTCALLGPRSSDNKWLASYFADDALHAQALTAEGGALDGFRVQYPSSSATPMMRWDAGGHVIVSTDGGAEGARRYAVGEGFLLEDSLIGFAGDASGDTFIDGGKLFTTTTDGIDIREAGDLNRFLQYPTPGRVDAIARHEDRIFVADAPGDGAVTLREVGCP